MPDDIAAIKITLYFLTSAVCTLVALVAGELRRRAANRARYDAFQPPTKEDSNE